LRHNSKILGASQAVARKRESSETSHRKNESDKTNPISKRNLLSNKQVPHYYFVKSILQNSKQRMDNQFVSKPYWSSIDFNFGNIQTKLKVSQPGDIYEQEADRVAEQVMRMSVQEDHILSIHGINEEKINRKCQSCQDEEEEKMINRKTANDEHQISEDVALSVGNARQEGGIPLDASTRAFIEPRFGIDFSKVRVHTYEKAAESANVINALAYTSNNDIVFGEGRYRPRTNDGKYLLAHELAHVIQQNRRHVDSETMVSRQTDDKTPEIDRDFPLTSPVELTGHAEREFEHPAPNFVAYDGNQLLIFREGKLVKRADAVSGNPGHEEYEKNVGPIPDGKYLLSPNIVRRGVDKLENGTCGALGITSGIQEIRSNDASPCADPSNHYCTVSCPTSDHPAQRCYTPMDCWGRFRIRIEGSKTVETPAGEKVSRGGFYIHGGNHDVPVTSGCIKIFDDSVFTELQKFKKPVPLIVSKNR
jgi:hypothetical protein